MTLPPKTRKAILAFMAFLIIIGILGVYFFFVVQKGRQQLTDKNFRILERKSQNIIEKVDNFDFNVKNAKEQVCQKLDAKPIDYTAIDSDNIASILESHLNEAIADSIINKYFKVGTVRIIKQQQNKAQEEKTQKNQLAVMATSSERLSVELGESKSTEEQKVVRGKILDSTYIANKWVLQAFEKPTQNNGERLYFELYQQLSSFLTPLLWHENFDEFLLVNSRNEIMYQSGVHDVHEIRIDSLLKSETKNHSLLGSTEKEVHFKGLHYKLYSQPFSLSNGDRYVLIGMMEQGKFKSKVHQISPFAVIVASVLFILILFSFPFLKIWLISKTERLDRKDLLFCLVSLFATTCIALLLTLDLFQYRHYKVSHIDKNLEKVSNTIVRNFTDELKAAVRQLKTYDDMSSFSIDTLQDGSVMLTPTGEIDTIYPHANLVSWIKPNGKQARKYLGNSKMISVRDREYFKKLNSGNTWKISLDGKKENDFYVQSIYSRSTGLPKAEIAIPSESDKAISVISMTATLQSVFDPILTHGYQFAFINGTGEVLFHSDKRRNNQENLLEDFSNPNLLKAAIAGRVPSSFEIDYSGVNYMVKFNTIENWPIYLVTFYDKRNFKSANAAVLITCLILLIAHGILFLFLFITIYMAGFRTSMLQFNIRNINWLLPHRQQGARYARVILFHFFGGIAYLATYYSIQSHDHSTLMPVLMLAYLSLPYLVIGSYFLLQPKFTKKSLGRHILILILFGVVACLINASVYTQAIPKSGWFIYQLAMVVAFLFSYFSVLLKVPTVLKFPLSYKTALLSLLIVTCFPAVFTFYNIAHDVELKLYVKMAQLDLAGKIAGLDDNASDNHYKMHLSPLVKIDEHPGELLPITPEDSGFVELYSKIRPLYSDRLVNTHSLYKPASPLKNWYWKDQKGVKKGNSITEDALEFVPNSGKKQILTSNLHPYQGEHYSVWELLFIWMLILAILAILFVLIDFVFRRTVPQAPLKNSRLLEDPFLYRESSSDPVVGFKHVFLVGLPLSGKTYFFERILRNHDNEYQVINLRELIDESPALTDDEPDGNSKEDKYPQEDKGGAKAEGSYSNRKIDGQHKAHRYCADFKKL